MSTNNYFSFISFGRRNEVCVFKPGNVNIFLMYNDMKKVF